MLENRGLVPFDIKTAVSTFGVAQKEFFSKVKNRDIIIFTRQLSVLLKSGLPILEALGICSRQSLSHNLANIINGLQIEIKNGKSLSQALSQHPTVFNNIYCSLVKAGEETGALDAILNQLSQMIAYEEEVKKELKSALRYPTAVLFFLIGAFFIILTFVIPKMSNHFSKAGVELPLPTRICISLNNLISNHWFVFTLTAALLLALFIWFKRTPKGRYVYDKTILKIPYFGELITQSTMYRFSYIYSILSRSGISVLKSMDILSEVVGNTAVARDFIEIKNGVEEGVSVSSMIKQSPCFTEMMGSMIAVGERTGDMDKLLAEAADFYNVEMKYAIKRLTDVLPVVLTVIMAIMVGFFVLAIYLPLFEMSKVAGGMK